MLEKIRCVVYVFKKRSNASFSAIVLHGMVVPQCMSLQKAFQEKDKINGRLLVRYRFCKKTLGLSFE